MTDNKKDNSIRRFIRFIFDRESARQVDQQTNAALAASGKKGGESFLRELKAAFSKRMVDLRVQLSKGLIDPREFKRQSDLAAREFNSGLIKGMEEARRQGRLTEAEYLKLGRQLKTVGDTGATAWDRIKGGIVSAGGALAAFFSLRSLGRFTVDLLKLGVAGAETASKFEVTFGRAAASVEAFLDDFTRLAGISKTEGKEFTATVGAMARGMGFTEEAAADLARQVLTVAGDLTSFNNVPLEETLQAVRSAITGERESLKRLGIVILETDVQKRALVETGKENAKTLTQEEKAAATLHLIMERMGPAAGDLVRTQDSLANVARRVEGAWKDLKEELGKALLKAQDGEGILNKLAGALRYTAKHADDLVGILGSLAKALLLVGSARVIGAVVSGLNAATAGVARFAVMIRSLYRAVGPAGWVVLGLTVVAELFRRSGEAAEAAADKAKKAVEDLRASVQDLDQASITANLKTLRAQKDALQKKVDAIQAVADAQDITGKVAEAIFGGGVGKALEAAREEVGAVQDQINILLHEQNARPLRKKPRTTPGTGTGEDEDGEKAAKKQAELFAQRKAELEQEIADLGRLRQAQTAGTPSQDALNQQLAREAELRAAIKDLAPEQAAELERLIAVRNRERDAIDAAAQAERDRQADQETYDRLAIQDRAEMERQEAALQERRKAAAAEARMRDAERAGPDAVAALNRELYIQQALLDAGATAGSKFADTLSRIAGEQYDAAHEFASPWVGALGAIENEINGKGTLLKELSQAWAEDGAGGVAVYAKAKVKENIAAALEETAKAFGSLALGNPKAAWDHAQSALAHEGAAVAWGVAASTAGGSGGGGGVSAGSGSISNPSAGQSTQPPGPEVSIYLTGPGFDALNPEVQKIVYGAQQQARERYGSNANVRVVRRAGG